MDLVTCLRLTRSLYSSGCPYTGQMMVSVFPGICFESIGNIKLDLCVCVCVYLYILLSENQKVFLLQSEDNLWDRRTFYQDLTFWVKSWF